MNTSHNGYTFNTIILQVCLFAANHDFNYNFSPLSNPIVLDINHSQCQFQTVTNTPTLVLLNIFLSTHLVVLLFSHLECLLHTELINPKKCYHHLK